MRGRCWLVIVFALAVVASANSATADEIKIDINSIVISAGGVFAGTSHTGTLQLSMDTDSNLFGIQINNGFNLVSGNAMTGFSGSINLSNGAVTGGSFTVTAGGDSYTAMIVPNSGSVKSQAGQGYTIDGLTFQGFFSGSTFAGVNVMQWFDAQPLDGTFINLFFNPKSNGVDRGADMDLVANSPVMPMPAAAGMGLVGLALVASRRRRMA